MYPIQTMTSKTYAYILSLFMLFYQYPTLLSITYIIYRIYQHLSPIHFASQGEGVTPLHRGTRHSAGWDICSTEDVSVPPRGRKLIKTGVQLTSIPPGHYVRVAPRSSLAVQGIDVGAGVVDADYRGEIRVLLMNHTDLPYEVTAEQRIAQLIVEKHLDVPIYWNGIRMDNQGRVRGVGGFGFTNTA